MIRHTNPNLLPAPLCALRVKSYGRANDGGGDETGL